jgi:hypothetical protein
MTAGIRAMTAHPRASPVDPPVSRRLSPQAGVLDRHVALSKRDRATILQSLSPISVTAARDGGRAI